MTEAILDPNYWRERMLRATGGNMHHAIFRCSYERWRRIEEKHREILARTIGEDDSVLDCGCGWGRLLDLMPDQWDGAYLGIDLSPDFVAKAERDHPEKGGQFLEADLRRLPSLYQEFDWAILVSIRPMVRRNCGDEVWAEMEGEIRRVARKLLYLEYDENDEGSIE